MNIQTETAGMREKRERERFKHLATPIEIILNQMICMSNFVDDFLYTSLELKLFLFHKYFIASLHQSINKIFVTI